MSRAVAGAAHRVRTGEPVVKALVRRGRGLRWRGVKLERYKRANAGEAWSNVTRQVLFAGSRGDAMAFDVRYFEVTGRGYSSLESHHHAHAVVGMRGQGRVRIGPRWYQLRPFDACYIGPNVAHQLCNAGTEPFGFLCVVDAKRAAGRPVGEPARRRARKGQSK